VPLESDANDAIQEPQADSTSHALAILFVVLVGVLCLLALTGTVVAGAVDSLLAGPAGSCGGP
jgi:hypothetical protein